MAEQLQKLWPFKPLVFSTVLLSFGIAAALDLGVFHFAKAAQTEKARSVDVVKTSAKIMPIVFARYNNSETITIQQTAEEKLPCKKSNAFLVSEKPALLGSKIDFCAPAPTLTTQDTPSPAITKWRLPHSPSEIIWQQDVPAGQKLIVELVQSDGLQWPAVFTSSELGTKVSIRGVPSDELLADQEIFLNASLYGADGKRIENWVIAISVDKNASPSVPWAAKS